MSESDALGDRMKRYESAAESRLMPFLPILVRLDGRGFSKFTKGLARPYDERMSQLMIDTAKHVLRETQAIIGYTQSDEISLVLDSTSDMMFDGRIQKLSSVCAAICTQIFNEKLGEAIPEKKGTRPVFDCRVWNVPNKTEAANALLWRERDATKNSLQMAAHALFTPAMMHGMNGSDLHQMLHLKGVNWDKYPTFFKRGTFIKKVKSTRPFTVDELSKLPPRHEAHRNPDLFVERTETIELMMPPFGRVINREDVIFNGALPQLDKSAICKDPEET